MSYNSGNKIFSRVLLKKILFFAIPLAASSILQQFFNAADVAVAGHFAGPEALAAVGANTPVINLLINLFVGLSTGSNVAVAVLTGRKDYDGVQKAVHTSILLALFSGIFLAAAGILFAHPILKLIYTPDNIIDLAEKYLKIYFIGMPFIMLFNFSSAVLRCKGDTERPLIALICAGIINIILNLFFVIYCRMNIEGVALATTISNFLSAGMLIIVLIKENGNLKLCINKLKLNYSILFQIAAIGIPAGIQGMMFSVSNVCVQSALNRLGSPVIASTAAAINYECAVYFIFNAFTQACVTFVGQNYGAGKIKRCIKIIKSCLMWSILTTTALCIIIIIFGRTFAGIFTNDDYIADLTVLRLKYILSFEFLNIIAEILSGAMRGFGHSLTPALICVIFICILRVVWVYTIFPLYPEYETILSVYPISWLFASAAIITAYSAMLKKIIKEQNNLD